MNRDRALRHLTEGLTAEQLAGLVTSLLDRAPEADRAAFCGTLPPDVAEVVRGVWEPPVAAAKAKNRWCCAVVAAVWLALMGAPGPVFGAGVASRDAAEPADGQSPHGLPDASPRAHAMARERIGISADGRHFVGVSSGRRFVAWGCNYDHDETGRLLEDYWVEDWSRIEADFAEMRHLGANLVRIHLQFGRFIPAPGQPDAEALARLRRLIDLAEETGLYLDITGLGCYHRADTPAWYDEASEEQRWAAQAAFWQAVATVGAGRPAVFCYDLMNEPILPGVGKPEKDWLAGEFGGKHFVQRIALDLGERTREEVAGAWVRSLVQAIRKRDRDSLITVGVIPWALTFPKARPLFHGAAAGADLDFVSIHVYPRKGEIDRAVEALATYDVGKPILIEEMFPLHCSADELLDFVERSRPTVDGWVSFYWGTTAEEYAARPGIPAALKREWLRRFAGKAEEMKERPERTP